MTTGNHTIRDISCCKCGTTLGRKYVNALFNLLHSWVHRTSRSRRTNCRRSTRKVNISLSVVSSWTFSRFACTPSWRRYYTAAMIQGAGFIVFVSLFALITSMYHRKGEGCWRCPHGRKKFSCNDYHVPIPTAIFSFLSSTNLAKTARCTLFISHLLSTNQEGLESSYISNNSITCQLHGSFYPILKRVEVFYIKLLFEFKGARRSCISLIKTSISLKLEPGEPANYGGCL